MSEPSADTRVVGRYPLEPWIAFRAQDHVYDPARQCCSCGFGVWSPEHVAVMAYRDAVDDISGLRVGTEPA